MNTSLYNTWILPYDMFVLENTIVTYFVQFHLSIVLENIIRTYCNIYESIFAQQNLCRNTSSCSCNQPLAATNHHG